LSTVATRARWFAASIDDRYRSKTFIGTLALGIWTGRDG
jgi:hypothetical protein